VDKLFPCRNPFRAFSFFFSDAARLDGRLPRPWLAPGLLFLVAQSGTPPSWTSRDNFTFSHTWAPLEPEAEGVFQTNIPCIRSCKVRALLVVFCRVFLPSRIQLRVHSFVFGVLLLPAVYRSRVPRFRPKIFVRLRGFFRRVLFSPWPAVCHRWSRGWFTWG